MRLFVLAAIAAVAAPGLASGAPRLTSLAQPAPEAKPAESGPAPMRVAIRQQTLPAGGRIEEHRPDGLRYLYVVSGRLKVSDLVTGEEQVVEAGKMAAEEPGDWHVAEAIGADPVTLYVIDRTPADGPAPKLGGVP